jgi:hypothetical protein
LLYERLQSSIYTYTIYLWKYVFAIFPIPTPHCSM